MAKFDFSDLNSESSSKGKFDFSDLNTEEAAPTGMAKIPHALGMVGKDVGHLLQALPGTVVHGILNLPKDVRYLKENIPEVANQVMTDPSRAGRNAVTGLARLGHETLNVPSGMANYLSKIGLISPESAAAVPRQHDITPELNDFVGGKQKGDELIQGTFANLPLVLGAGSLIKNAASSGISAATYPVRKISEAVGDYKNSRDLGEAEKKLAHIERATGQAERQASDAANLEGQAKSAAHIEAGSNNPDVLQRKINTHKESLDDINAKMAAIPEIATEIPKLETNSQETFANLTKANEAHEQAKQTQGAIESAISEHLNKGADHGVRAAAGIDKIQTNIHESISAQYDAIKKNLKDKKIEVSNPREAKDILGEINELVKTGQHESPEAKKLANELYNLKSKEAIPANDYLTAYRAVKQHAREARVNAYTPGMNAEERSEWMKKYNELDEKTEEMGKVLEKGIGLEDAEALRKANQAWRTQVVPLYKNKTYQDIRFKGRMPDDIMKTLRGTDTGDAILKNIIKSDPEILKNVVGQKYAKKPSLLHDAGEREQEYLDHMPDLKGALEHHKRAQNSVETTKRLAENASVQHEKTLLDEKNAEKVAAQVEKQRVADQNLRDKLESERARLEKEVSTAEKHAANLKRLAENKKLSLKEKARLEMERERLEKIVEEKKASQARLYRKGTKLAKTAAMIGGGTYAGNKIFNNLIGR